MHDENKSSINYYLLSLQAVTTLKVMVTVTENMTVTKMPMITDDADRDSGGDGDAGVIIVAMVTTVRMKALKTVVTVMPV